MQLLLSWTPYNHRYAVCFFFNRWLLGRSQRNPLCNIIIIIRYIPFLFFSLLVLSSVSSVLSSVLWFCLLFFPSRFSDSLQEATLGSVRKQNITLIVLSQKRSLLNSGVSNRVVCYQILTNFLLALTLRGCRSSCDAWDSFSSSTG